MPAPPDANVKSLNWLDATDCVLQDPPTFFAAGVSPIEGTAAWIAVKAGVPKNVHTQFTSEEFVSKNAGRLMTADTGIGEPPLIVSVAPVVSHAVIHTGLPEVSFKNTTSMLPDGQTPDGDPLQSIAARTSRDVNETLEGAVKLGLAVPLIVPVPIAAGMKVVVIVADEDDQVRVGVSKLPARPAIVGVIVPE